MATFVPPTYAQAMKHVRRWTLDANPSDYAIGTRALGNIVDSVFQEWHEKIGFEQVELSVTLTAGTDPPTFALLASGTDPIHVSHVRRGADGFEVERVTWQELLAMRAGLTHLSGSDVNYYAWFKDPSGGLQIGFDVVVTQNRTVKLVTVGGRANIDNFWVPGSWNDTTGLWGLEPVDLPSFYQACAARACAMMPEAQRANLGLTPDYVAMLATEGRRGLRRAEVRAWQFKMGERTASGRP